MDFKTTKIPDVIIVEPTVHGDDRGFFFETYREENFAAAGIVGQFVQDNHSGSVQGTLRGLHYQIQGRTPEDRVFLHGGRGRPRAGVRALGGAPG